MRRIFILYSDQSYRSMSEISGNSLRPFPSFEIGLYRSRMFVLQMMTFSTLYTVQKIYRICTLLYILHFKYTHEYTRAYTQKKSHWYILRIEPTDFDSHCIYFEYTQLYHVRSWRIQCLRIPLRDTMHRR